MKAIGPIGKALPRRFIQSLALLVIAGLLVGCGARLPPLEPDVREQRWAAREAMLQNADQWRLEGRVAIHHADDGGPASLEWRQVGTRFEVKLRAPLGQGRLQLTGSPGRVFLTLDDGRVVTAGSVDDLLQVNLGWSLPLAGLRYWILGVDRPNGEDDVILDDRGRPELIKGLGWTVAFQSYRSTYGIPMPYRLEAHRDETRIRVVIAEWDLPFQAAADRPPAPAS